MGGKKSSKININDNSSQSSRTNEDESSQSATERTSSISYFTPQLINPHILFNLYTLMLLVNLLPLIMVLIIM